MAAHNIEQFCLIKSFQDRLQLLQDFRAEKDFWVVPDLATQRSFQNKVVSDRIWRLSDLWSHFLKAKYKTIKIVNKSQVLFYIQVYLENTAPLKWQAWPKGSDCILLEALTELAPMLSHPQGFDILTEFLRENMDSQRNWGLWCQEAFKLWQQLFQKKVFYKKWLGACLYNEVEFPVFTKGRLFFDAGTSLLKHEADIINTLSHNHRVVICVPFFYKKQFRSYSHYSPKPYERWQEQINTTLENESSVTTDVTPKRYASPLSEVKEAAVTVHQWIHEENVPSQNIVIVAPQMSLYWVMLETHFKKEGIPVAFNETFYLQKRPDIQRWMSLLKLCRGDIHVNNLEVCGYSQDVSRFGSVKEFHNKLFSISQTKDLKRLKPVEDFFKPYRKRWLQLKPKISCQDFCQYLSDVWQDLYPYDKPLIKKYPQILEAISLYQTAYSSSKNWLSYLESLVCDISETSSNLQDFQGVICQDIDSFDFFENREHVYFMGLSHRKVSSHSFLSSDLQMIENQTGFSLHKTENNKAEQKVSLLQSFAVRSILSFSETDFSGRELSPSLIWMMYGAKTPLQTPRTGTWNEQQQKRKSLKPKVAQKELNKPIVSSLSASTIEKYYKCPFIVFAEKGLHLSSTPALDLDIDAMKKGGILHKLAEKLTNLDEDMQPLEAKVKEMVRTQLRESFYDSSIQEAFLNHCVNFAKTFLKKEQEQNQGLPQLKIAASEKKITGIIEFDSRTKEWRFIRSGIEPDKKVGFTFSGYIDRINEVEEGAVIIDYKSSTASKHNFKLWSKHGEFQLYLYVKALESGLAGKPYSVLGALYYDFKSFEQKKGFMWEEGNNKSFTIPKGYRSKMTTERWKALEEQMQEIIGEVLSGIASGQMSPRPHDEGICKSCSWRSLCRAAHLE